jgi:hypothetical protein
MPEPVRNVRATLTRLRTLTIADAYERIVDGDPLDLESRARAALVRDARWLPVDVVTMRAARRLAAALRDSPSDEDTAALWVDAHVADALCEVCNGSPPSETREREAWARHHAKVAAMLGVHERLGADACVLFDALPSEDRRLALDGMRFLREGRTRDIDAATWSRFDALWRRLVRSVLAAGSR